ncbi:MAG: hypothetical protein Ct9H90mP17_4380 [Actinomycetota bacterium]|nr:MAG: hypothetical protein Ct9H90mP17_4380 [Actinomycetota bacterium]
MGLPHTANLGTKVGFLTNIVSPLTQLQDFGITTAFGIFYAFILVMTLVPAIRTLLDKRAEKKNSIDVDALHHPVKSYLKDIALTAIIPKKLKFLAMF